MIFQRMDNAIIAAGIEQSKPQQFSLSYEDYKEFKGTPHSDKSYGPIEMHYGRYPVVEATDENSSSVLHVSGTKPIFENPIHV